MVLRLIPILMVLMPLRLVAQEIVFMILVAVFCPGGVIFAIRSNCRSHRAHSIIGEQKHLVEEKLMEILDRIQYARRIQHSLLTPVWYIERLLNRQKNKLS